MNGVHGGSYLGSTTYWNNPPDCRTTLLAQSGHVEATRSSTPRMLATSCLARLLSSWSAKDPTTSRPSGPQPNAAPHESTTAARADNMVGMPLGRLAESHGRHTAHFQPEVRRAFQLARTRELSPSSTVRFVKGLIRRDNSRRSDGLALHFSVGQCQASPADRTVGGRATPAA